MNDCRTAFMDAPSPWSRDEDPALAMYAYLASLPGPAQPVPVSLVEPPIADLPGGDPSAGTVVYERACRTCHGALHDGQGRRGAFIPVLPEEVIAQHASLNLSPAATRAVFIQKMRRGNADVPGQSMPPFSREVLSDQDISGLLALFGL
jgi:mono/diheme cytochrome c family protein